MSTTNIPAPPANHKGCEVNQNRDERARQAAFQRCAHTHEMLSQTQPRNRSDAAQSGAMNCALLQWVAQQDDLPPHLQAILLRLVKLMDEHGSVALSQADIAPHVRLGERQTRAAIKELVALGALHRKRRGAVRKGRAPDALSVNFERQHDTGSASPVSVDNSDSAVTSPVSTPPHDNGGSGDPSPVSQKASDNGGMPPVSKKLPHIENAPARAEPLTNNSKRIGSDLIASKEMIEALIDRAAGACDPTAPGLHHGADLNRLLRAGCDWTDDILPAVDKLVASFRRRGGRFSTWALLEEHAVEFRNRRQAGVTEPPAVLRYERPRNGVRRNLYLEACAAK